MGPKRLVGKQRQGDWEPQIFLNGHLKLANPMLRYLKLLLIFSWTDVLIALWHAQCPASCLETICFSSSFLTGILTHPAKDSGNNFSVLNLKECLE